MDCSMSGSSVLHYLPEFAQIHVHWVSDAIEPFHPLSPPSPSAFNLSQHQVFSNELALHIRWSKYWSFSFSIGPSNEYLGLISFRIDWFDLLAVQGTLKSLLQHGDWVYLRSQIPCVLHMVTAWVCVPVVLLELSVFLDAQLSFTLYEWILTHPSLVPLFNSLGEFHFGLVKW